MELQISESRNWKSRMNEILILKTQRALEKLKYPTPLAISKEIVEFCKCKETDIKEVLGLINKGTPWEYIRGYTYFRKNKILLNKNVLIPRIETEELVQKALENTKVIKQIIDVGTGSGCIAISLSKHFKGIIYTTDVSTKALEIAKKNVKLNNCKNIKVVKANLLEFKFNKKIPTMIVANLPYIPSENIKELDISVKNYEPLLALDGGKEGTEIYNKLLKQMDSVNVKYAIFEIDPENQSSLAKEGLKYKTKFLKDQFGKVRFLEMRPNPSLPK
jgi:release factor glutamine methyltransferase